jgi:hypothetical protein
MGGLVRMLAGRRRKTILMADSAIPTIRAVAQARRVSTSRRPARHVCIASARRPGTSPKLGRWSLKIQKRSPRRGEGSEGTVRPTPQDEWRAESTSRFIRDMSVEAWRLEVFWCLVFRARCRAERRDEWDSWNSSLQNECENHTYPGTALPPDAVEAAHRED